MPSKEKPYKYMVRLPAQMRDQLAESAQHYRRSINSDIVARLQQSFSGIPNDDRERALAPPLHDQFEQMFRQELSAEERELIRTYRRLGKHKRSALQILLA
jgi:hypothetical protein